MQSTLSLTFLRIQKGREVERISDGDPDVIYLIWYNVTERKFVDRITFDLPKKYVSY
jgi:hypothetical protein